MDPHSLIWLVLQYCFIDENVILQELTFWYESFLLFLMVQLKRKHGHKMSLKLLQLQRYICWTFVPLEWSHLFLLLSVWMCICIGFENILDLSKWLIRWIVWLDTTFFLALCRLCLRNRGYPLIKKLGSCTIKYAILFFFN